MSKSENYKALKTKKVDSQALKTKTVDSQALKTKTVDSQALKTKKVDSQELTYQVLEPRKTIPRWKLLSVYWLDSSMPLKVSRQFLDRFQFFNKTGPMAELGCIKSYMRDSYGLPLERVTDWGDLT